MYKFDYISIDSPELTARAKQQGITRGYPPPQMVCSPSGISMELGEKGDLDSTLEARPLPYLHNNNLKKP